MEAEDQTRSSWPRNTRLYVTGVTARSLGSLTATKEKTGKLTNNPDLETEGKVERMAGQVQKKIGQVKKVFGTE